MSFLTTSFTESKQIILLILLAIGLNVNTLFNQYAVDDEVVMTKNSLVSQGFSGIPKILTTDLMYGTPDANNALAQARYRPIILVIFAVEYQLFGAKPIISHLINIVLFALLITLLFVLLKRFLFNEQPALFAFVVCLFYVAHPIHTEVIANVKSRDEIVTFIFLLVSLFTFLHYLKKQSIVNLIVSMLAFFLALLTRESAATTIAVVPLIAYFFLNRNVTKSLLTAFPFIGVFCCYLFLRFSIVGMSHPVAYSIMDSPFLYASNTEALATKTFILLKTMVLLFFPYPLSCDYGYNQIPYVGILSWQFIVSSICLLVLLGAAIIGFKRKSILSFLLFYYFITISLATNFIVDIGTPLSERLLFQPSLAFCILLSLLCFKSINISKPLTITAFTLILVLYSVKTISRNTEWENNASLYFKDAESAPNSVRTNLYAAVNYVLRGNAEQNQEQRRKDYLQAIYYGERSRDLFNKYPDTYLALGYAYFGIHDNVKAADNWIKANQLDSRNTITQNCLIMLSDVFFKEGYAYYNKHNIIAAINYYKKAVELNEGNVEAWYQLGGVYFLLEDTKNGIEAWQYVLNMAPNHRLQKSDFHN